MVEKMHGDTAIVTGLYRMRGVERGKQFLRRGRDGTHNRVQVFGSTAIAVGTYREKQAKGGPPGIRRWRFMDTWVDKQTGWVLVAAAATALAK